MFGEKRFVTQVFLNQDAGQRGQTPGIGAGLDPQVVIGQRSGVGAHRVDHDHRAVRILADLVEHHPGPREALRHPWVLADEHRHFGVLELPAGVPSVQVCIHPGFAGLLLRQRVGPVPRAERFEERAAVGTAEMIALPAAAVVEDLVPTVVVGDSPKPVGDLRNRGVPIDFLVTAVGAAPHRGAQPGRVVLVEVQPQRLIAGVAGRGGMGLVAPDLRQMTALGLYDDAAVALAQDAGGGGPVGGHGPGHGAGPATA